MVIYNDWTLLKNASWTADRSNGISGDISGCHLYVYLELKRSLLLTSISDERQKGLQIIEAFVDGIEKLAKSKKGEILEVQDKIVHIFFPANEENYLQTLDFVKILDYVLETKVRRLAGDNFIKLVYSASYGRTLFIKSESAQGDCSIISLSPAANVPAKCLWANIDAFTDSTFLYCNSELSKIEKQEDLKSIVFKEDFENLKESILCNRKMTVMAKVPDADAPEYIQPTIKDPEIVYAGCIRADMDGFTKRVKESFSGVSRETPESLANEFYKITLFAKEFCSSYRQDGFQIVQMNWAGDCFTALLTRKNSSDYQEDRKFLYARFICDFEIAMKKQFPHISWSYSYAAGDIENAQKCNTMIARLRLNNNEHPCLIAFGMPIAISHQLLNKVNIEPSHGILPTQDKEMLKNELKGDLTSYGSGYPYWSFSVKSWNSALHSKAIVSFLSVPEYNGIKASPPRPYYSK